ncbi:MAG TPA: hypothetical protein VG498_00385 [Terriglobales bacterium]|nr:hypothetical protein [Terriglobales bacterium]
MKFVKPLVLSLLLLISASLAAAADGPSGKFTIGHDTRWGTAVLPAGTYFVAIHSGPVPYVLVTSEKNSVSIMAVAQYVTSAECKTSSLELEQTDGSWNVRSLCFESQTAVYFGPSKSMTVISAKAASSAASPVDSN